MNKPPPGLEELANGINFALAAMNRGRALDFILIVAEPKGGDLVTYRTITGIQDAAAIRGIGKHLIDMANEQEPELDPYDDTDVRGHA